MHRKAVYVSVWLFLAACGFSQGDDQIPRLIQQGNEKPVLRLVVQLSIFPDESGLVAWNTVINANQQVPVAIIASPPIRQQPTETFENFKGSVKAYTNALARANKGGVPVYGYMTASRTKEGGRWVVKPLAEVVDEANLLWGLYGAGLSGVFIDEQSTDPDDIAAVYKPLASHIRAKWASGGKRASIISNPGTIPPETTLKAETPAEPPKSNNKTDRRRKSGAVARQNRTVYYADIACIVESDGPGEFRKFSLPAWGNDYSADRFLAMFAGEPDLAGAVRHAVAQRCYNLFVTDKSGDVSINGRYTSLPSYWPQLVESVRQINNAPPMRPNSVLPGLNGK
jgi:hypothetical protein